MERFKQYLLATAGLFLFVSVSSLMSPIYIAGAPPEGLQGHVTVTNIPLPMTGTITGTVDANVTNASLNVNAAQFGTWNVGITNSEGNPIPVVVQNGNAVVKELLELTGSLRHTTESLVLYTVPTGRRLLITDVIIMASLFTGFNSDPRVGIERDGVIISQPSVGGSKYQQTYSSPIEFKEGVTVGI